MSNPETSAVSFQRQWIDDYQPQCRITEYGRVVSIGDGIAWVDGLPSAGIEELLHFEDGSEGLVFHLDEKHIGVILLNETGDISAGSSVQLSRKKLAVPVGEKLIGRVIDPLGNPLDGASPPECHHRQLMEVASPSIRERDDVHRPLNTGIKLIDSMIPIGKGQRQLIIGDEGLGRSSIAIDTVINQKDKNVTCVYVLIGQKRSDVVNVIHLLESYGALEYTVIVVGEASALPGLKYITPYAGCAIAEFWMRQGRDTLVIYDDLSTHAKAYRELSLLLKRPPGREAYPGDVFFLHARLLERATCLSPELGGGSMTALPIVETRQGEIADYIPTNLISITDGQIYLERTLFSAGFRPAIDVAKSVSRIGGKAQHRRIKEEAGRMKLDYLQFLELEVFTRFGAKLEASMEKAIKRGRVLRELLKQKRFKPLSPQEQLAWLIAFNDGVFDDIEPERIPSILDHLLLGIRNLSLSMNKEREAWSQAIQHIFAHKVGKPLE
ncbi:MAG: F0F1 ATP synthase subunit alpha [Gammaproteobacteria bacterium]|nr:F0F1 ATP synthase subunit alpha [Gammaproteobacteria bacterium]